MKLDSRVEQALQAINFVERYKELSDKFSLDRTPKDKRLNIITGELVFDVFEDLGYRAKFDGREKFFYIEPFEENGYTFGFHISIFKGLVELIWIVKDSQNKVILGTPLIEFSRRLISPDYRIMDPVISNYDDFENVMKIAFEMYEDFKQAFLKIATEGQFFEKMLKDFTKVADMLQEVIEKYKEQVPAELLQIWQEDGLGAFLDGYLKVINPDDYLELLQDSYFRGDVAFPMFITAFGDIITWEKNEFVGIVKYNLQDCDIILKKFKIFSSVFR